jgi:hypothetical protein
VTALLLVLAAGCCVLPDVLPVVFGGSRAAWDYVTSGAGAACLWAFAFLVLARFEARLICAWAMFEALQRPVCRLVFPMDKPVKLEDGQNLCDAAFHVPATTLSLLLALFLAAFVQEVQRVRRPA